MTSRLGNALLVVCVVAALGWVWLNSYMQQDNMTPVLIVSGVVVLVGLLVRYVLAGNRSA